MEQRSAGGMMSGIVKFGAKTKVLKVSHLRFWFSELQATQAKVINIKPPNFISKRNKT